MGVSLLDCFLCNLGCCTSLCFNLIKNGFGYFHGLVFALWFELGILGPNTCLAGTWSLLSFSFVGKFLSLLFFDELFDLGVWNWIDVSHQLVLNIHTLFSGCLCHSTVEESLLAGSFDFIDSLHGLHSFDHQVTVIPDWDIASLLKFQDTIIGHLFAVSSSWSFSPLELARILFTFEKFVAFWWAETEVFSIIPYEDSSVSRVDIRGAEIALFDSHIY